MRIIAGLARGLPLKSPVGDTRPTLDRVREAMLGSLEPLTGKIVVDLFAGSGALGLEALSRGAAAVYWVEQDARNRRIITENLDRLRAAIGPEPITQVLAGDALKVHRLLPQIQPDFVLADPPWTAEAGPTLGNALLTVPELPAWLGAGLLVLEQSQHHPPELATLARWRILRQRRYGETMLHYLKAAG
jgi:16S rRNA (guanine966-N2)-methyltransferase